MALIVRDDGATATAPARVAQPFTPSPQQEAFLEGLAATDAHLLLEARAGSGKSTTCRQGAWTLARAGYYSTYACFNAHIAREFQADLPAGCKAATLHSLGLGLLRYNLGQVEVDNDKLDRLAERFFPGREERSARYAAAWIANLCRDMLIDGTDADQLATLAAGYDVELPAGRSEEILAVIPEVLKADLEHTATVDFGDMIWMPVQLGLKAGRSPEVLFVDEAQDLNPCQHELLGAICHRGRIVVVGDRHQSIYAFRGADAQSIARLEGRLSVPPQELLTFPLTVTRRCPHSHVELARRLVPDLEALPTAIEGTVTEIGPEQAAIWCQPGDMVLCRTNAPLVGLCYRLLRDNRRAFIRGRDIGKGLLALIARLRARDVADLLRKVADFRIREIEKLAELRNPGPAIAAINDKCDTLTALCEGAESLDEVRRRAEVLFSDLTEEGAVLLSSIHRAKGLERDRVLILRPDLLPGPWARTPEDMQQERNICYVAATRSKHTLAFAGPLPALLGGADQVVVPGPVLPGQLRLF